MDARELVTAWKQGQRVNARLVVQTYNQMFNAKENNTNCHRCLNRYLKAIDEYIQNIHI